MKLFKRLIRTLPVLCIPAIIFAQTPTPQANSFALMYTLKGNAEKPYNALVEGKIKQFGFKLTDPHQRVNDQYEAKWGSTVLDVLSFLSVSNDKNILPLLVKDPRLAGFAPFNMLIYKTKAESDSHIGHLMPQAMLDILGIEDESIRNAYIASFEPLDKMIAEEFKDPKFGAVKSYLTYDKMAENPMIQFEYTFEEPEDMDEFIEEFQNKFELAFIDKGYLIAGYHNFKDDDEDDVLGEFDAFWTYSLCHLKFSYTMFDNEGARPDAGLFAPCTMYIYIKSGTNTLVFGMPTLNNWITLLNITDPKRVELAKELETEIPQILKEYGMVQINPVNTLTATEEEKKMEQTAQPVPQPETPNNAKEMPAQETPAQGASPAPSDKQMSVSEDNRTININIPTPPKVPEPVKVHTNGNASDMLDDRSIQFSKRVPPDWDANKYDKKTKEVASLSAPGEINSGRISAHLRGDYMEAAEVEKLLKAAGFDIISVSTIDKKKTLTTIVFTNKDLLSMSSKTNRGFFSGLRVLVDSKEKRISVTNPLYFAKAFLQNDFDEAMAKKTLSAVNKALHGLDNSTDALKFQILPEYQFMNGLPRYEEMQVVATGTDLEAKLKNNKNVYFTQKLPNGAILAGVQLGKRTSKFIDRIGTNNAALLPYPVLIENGEAKILDPKYYISIMYPMLKMSEFMTIATVPDAIKKDCEKIFE